MITEPPLHHDHFPHDALGITATQWIPVEEKRVLERIVDGDLEIEPAGNCSYPTSILLIENGLLGGVDAVVWSHTPGQSASHRGTVERRAEGSRPPLPASEFCSGRLR